MSDDLKQKTLGGLSWTFLAEVLGQILHFGVMVLLARLLVPEDFGLVAMVMVFTGFVGLFSDFGIGAALIQREKVTALQYSSVFWLNVTVGVALMLLMGVCAPLLAWFYDEPRLVPLTLLIAVQFPVASLKVVHNARLNRQFAFKKLAMLETVSLVVGMTAAVVLAVLGYGPYAIVWQSLSVTICSVGLLWAVSRWRPSFSFEWASVRELLSYGGNLLGFRTLNYWVRSADDLLVGRVVGSAALGVYERAYSFMMMPIRQVSRVVSRVMFPALSAIQNDEKRVKSIYLRALGAIALVTFPMMLGLFAVAELFVTALLGEKWSEIIPILKILCVVGLSQSIGTTVGWLYKSQGRTDLMLKWGVASGVVTLVAFVIGIQWGVIGITIAYLVRTYLLTYFNFTIPGKLIGLRFSEVVAAAIGPLGCAALMAACVILTNRFLVPLQWPDMLRLLAMLITGVGVYAMAVHALGLKAYKDVRGLLAERLNGGV